MSMLKSILSGGVRRGSRQSITMATTPADVVAETQDGWGIVAPSAAEDVDMQDAAAPTTSAAAAAGHHAGSNDISEGWATVDAATLTAQDAATTCSGAAADGGDLDDDSSPHKKARTSLVTSHVIPVHAPAPAPARPLAPSPYRDALNKAASSNPTGSGPAASVGRPAAAARPVLVAHRPRTRSVTLASAAAANDMALDRRDSMLGGAPAAAAAASAPVTADADLPWTGGYDAEDYEVRKAGGADHYHSKRKHADEDPNRAFRLAKRETQRQDEDERQRLRQQGLLHTDPKHQRKAARRAQPKGGFAGKKERAPAGGRR